MSIVSAIVLFLVTWFMVLFIMLPIGLETQGDKGEVVPGTPEGAPAESRMKRKALVTTIISLIIWVPLCALILSGWVDRYDLDFFNQLTPPSQ